MAYTGCSRITLKSLASLQCRDGARRVFTGQRGGEGRQASCSVILYSPRAFAPALRIDRSLHIPSGAHWQQAAPYIIHLSSKFTSYPTPYTIPPACRHNNKSTYVLAVYVCYSHEQNKKKNVPKLLVSSRNFPTRIIIPVARFWACLGDKLRYPIGHFSVPNRPISLTYPTWPFFVFCYPTGPFRHAPNTVLYIREICEGGLGKRLQEITNLPAPPPPTLPPLPPPLPLPLPPPPPVLLPLLSRPKTLHCSVALSYHVPGTSQHSEATNVSLLRRSELLRTTWYYRSACFTPHEKRPEVSIHIQARSPCVQTTFPNPKVRAGIPVANRKKKKN